MLEKLKKIDFGRYRIYLNRTQTYLALINFTMILYLYIVESPLGISWYFWAILMGIFIPLVLVFDVKLVYPGMLKYAYGKNPGFQRLEKKIDIIMKELGLEYGKK